MHISPLWFPTAIDAAGGRETVLAHLVSALDKLGCQGVVVATGDSDCAGELVPVLDRQLHALMKEGKAGEYVYYEQHQIALALQRAERGDVDLIHSHIGASAYFLSTLPRWRDRVLHTHHSPVYLDIEWYVRQNPDIWLTTVSHFQARRLAEHGTRHCEVIHNGITVSDFEFADRPRGDGLFFIGRMEHTKGPDIAARVARQTGRPMKLAGPITDQTFFDLEVAPHLGGDVEYIGIVQHQERNRLMADAACVVLPFRGHEPFGMVAIEAMACGTPVVALANGALPEIVENGVNGFAAADESELAGLVDAASRLDRRCVRDNVAARFGIPAIAKKYLSLYHRMLGRE